jgi:U3 small nucleolar ribonucleoprotein protein LCP5
LTVESVFKLIFGAATTGMGSAPSFSSGKARKLNEITSYEEENMTRLSMSKKESKRRREDEALVYGGGQTTNQRGKRAGGFEQEFGDLLGSIGREDNFNMLRSFQRAPAEDVRIKRSRSGKGQFEEALSKSKKRRRT